MMTNLEKLYANLLIASKALGGETIDHELVYRARDAVENSIGLLRAELNDKAKERGNKARDELRRGKSVPSSADIAPWPER